MWLYSFKQNAVILLVHLSPGLGRTVEFLCWFTLAFIFVSLLSSQLTYIWVVVLAMVTTSRPIQNGLISKPTFSNSFSSMKIIVFSSCRFCSWYEDPIDNKSALVLLMPGAEQATIHEPMMIYFTEANMHHSASASYTTASTMCNRSFLFDVSLLLQ